MFRYGSLRIARRPQSDVQYEGEATVEFFLDNGHTQRHRWNELAFYDQLAIMANMEVRLTLEASRAVVSRPAGAARLRSPADAARPDRPVPQILGRPHRPDRPDVNYTTSL